MVLQDSAPTLPLPPGITLCYAPMLLRTIRYPAMVGAYPVLVRSCTVAYNTTVHTTVSYYAPDGTEIAYGATTAIG
eukprot:756523-Rhodomonas_salina.1